VAAADKRLMVSSFPYLADSWASARKIYVSGSPLMNTVGELIAKQDIKLLAVWPVYFGGIALKKEPPAPTDPDAKQGLKVRVPPIKSYQVLANALGYQATPLPFSEAFTAMQTGIVDGVVGSGAEGYYSNFRDVTKFYLPVNTHFEQWYVIMNKGLFDGLSKADQDLVMKVARELEKKRWAEAEKDQALNEKKLADAGVKIVRFTPNQLAAFATKARKTVWPQIEGEVGQAWFQDLIKKMGIVVK
jgi:TRAP-type C4-dicarboxylate transport system substrate-binding protein